jgi:putative Holliday junction resolvase
LNVRALGIDLGARRIGLAISDVTGTLARPLTTLTVDGGDSIDIVAREIARLAGEDDGLSVIVVGMPARLDGTTSEAGARASAFIEALRRRTAIPIVSEDERLTSHEAQARLATRERDWRKRKLKLDAAAAAIFLQDFLDRR